MDSKIENLTQMKNIGKVVAEKLIQVGITTPEELCAIGERTGIHSAAND